jgi:hypothetical protein
LAPDVTEELVRKLDRGDDLNLLEEMRILTKKSKMVELCMDKLKLGNTILKGEVSLYN